jgi:hypothetical protein
MECQLIMANYSETYVLFQFILQTVYIVVDIFSRADICWLACIHINIIWLDGQDHVLLINLDCLDSQICQKNIRHKYFSKNYTIGLQV